MDDRNSMEQAGYFGWNKKQLMMRKIIAIGFMSALLSTACDNSADFLGGVNQSPTITLYNLNESGNIIEDSIKLSGEVGLFFYEVGVKVNDVNGNINVVNIDSASNRPTLLVQGDSILIDSDLVEINQSGDSVILQIALFNIGQNDIEITVIDDFEQRSVANLTLQVFENLPPVARVDVLESELSNELRTIDLSESYDTDQDFGGAVIIYNYRLNGSEFSIGESSLNYSFPGTGVYPVEVFVMDNNLEASTTLSFNIIID